MFDSTFPLNQIYFYLTEGCNLACRHCWLGPQYDPDGTRYATLPSSLLEKIIHEAKLLGLRGVKLTGGEPLLNQDFLLMLNVIRREGLALSLETNGTLCTPEHAAAIQAACERPFVSVSLDGVEAGTHDHIRGVPGAFAAAVRGIGHLVDAGLKPQIIFTVMKSNVGEVESIVRFAERLGAGSVKYNIVQPIARGENLHNRDETLTIEELVSLGRLVETVVAARTPLRIDYSHPAVFRPLGRIAADQGCGVCGVKGILGVLASGTYALCGIGEHIEELTFGHAVTDSLATIWETNPVLTRIRHGLPAELNGVCRRCLMKGICLGNCIAQNYCRTGNLMASYWYCEEALASGLFPQSRVREGPVHA